MIKCIIIDDEEPAHTVINDYVRRSKTLTVIRHCYNVFEAIPVLENYKVDLIFLDINLPLTDGLTFLGNLKSPPAVIITTAYSDYALEGFELNVTDYLLKPFSYERFEKAIKKVELIPQLTESSNEVAKFILVKEKNGIIKVNIDEIVFIEAAGDYMKLHTAAKTHLIYSTMKKLAEDLPQQIFVRIHKSYMVAVPKITILKTDSVLLENGISVPVSSNYKETVNAAFKK